MIRRAMLQRLKSIVGGAAGVGGGKSKGPEPDELHLAVAVMLVEAARMDESFDEEERAAIAHLIETRLDMSAEDATSLLDAADEVAENMGELWTFARVVKDRYSHEQRIEMIEMLWEVVYADGELHHYEANLLRRIAGLIYVSDRESGLARKRAMQRLGISDTPPA